MRGRIAISRADLVLYRHSPSTISSCLMVARSRSKATISRGEPRKRQACAVQIDLWPVAAVSITMLQTSASMLNALVSRNRAERLETGRRAGLDVEHQPRLRHEGSRRQPRPSRASHRASTGIKQPRRTRSSLLIPLESHGSSRDMGEDDEKGQQITIRVDAATARELREVAEMLSTEFIKATLADAVRAVVKAGLPVIRERLERAVPPNAPTRAPGTSAVRKKKTRKQ